ncbi:MAG TPA: VTT domain-containing protein [Acidimicrobiia bacterium]|nr:VTT domain-containing protein [Acidimicrobiia bacterium]
MTPFVSSLYVASSFLKIFDPAWMEQFLRDISPWQYVVLFAIIFAESGLLIGMFLPGDSLLFVAGFLAFKGDLNIWILLPLMFIAAFTGDQAGYTIGKLSGERFFKNENARILKKSHVDKTKIFFDKHGSKTIVIARFVPIVRTLAPVMAGTAKMQYKKFVSFNVIGAFLWAIGITLLGYFLGQSIGAETIDKYLLPIIALVVLLSLSPAIFEWIMHRRKSKVDIKN